MYGQSLGTPTAQRRKRLLRRALRSSLPIPTTKNLSFELSRQASSSLLPTFTPRTRFPHFQQGAHAVFGVTNFWEHLSGGKSRDESGDLEAAQAWKLARAAARTPTLEHYIWSTLPYAKKLSGGEFPCPHFDYKAAFDEKLKAEMPELAAKTTFLFMGYYPSNMVLLPMAKPVLIVRLTHCLPNLTDFHLSPALENGHS